MEKVLVKSSKCEFRPSFYLVLPPNALSSFSSSFSAPASANEGIGRPMLYICCLLLCIQPWPVFLKCGDISASLVAYLRRFSPNAGVSALTKYLKSFFLLLISYRYWMWFCEWWGVDLHFYNLHSTSYVTYNIVDVNENEGLQFESHWEKVLVKSIKCEFRPSFYLVPPPNALCSSSSPSFSSSSLSPSSAYSSSAYSSSSPPSSASADEGTARSTSRCVCCVCVCCLMPCVQPWPVFLKCVVKSASWVA